ncbi:MAG: hypothetical protein R3B59_00300 [Dehalococcoidia bacterium]
MRRSIPHSPRRVERDIRRVRYALLVSALWLTLLTVLPALDGTLAAYGPDHEHYTLAGVVPEHRHAYDADAREPSTSSCNAEASRDAEVTPVVCASSSDAAGPSTLAIAFGRGPAQGASPALTSVSDGAPRQVAYADPPLSMRTPPPRH